MTQFTTILLFLHFFQTINPVISFVKYVNEKTYLKMLYIKLTAILLKKKRLIDMTWCLKIVTVMIYSKL